MIDLGMYNPTKVREMMETYAQEMAKKDAEIVKMQERIKELESNARAVLWWREMGLSTWGQFAHYRTVEGKDKYHHMFLSVLEDLEQALLHLGLIDKDGVPQWEVLATPAKAEGKP